MRPRFSETELRGYAEAGLRYEFGTLQAAVRAVHAATKNTHEQHIALESALVHVRNLVEFFFTDKSDDVNVRDFFESDDAGRAWRESKPKDGRLPSDLAKRISVWLSHFSRERTGTNPEWNVFGYTQSLLALLSAFVGVMGRSRREWFAWTETDLSFDETSLGVYTTMTVTTASTISIPGPDFRGIANLLKDRDALTIPDHD
jgi:hypothetical protein